MAQFIVGVGTDDVCRFGTTTLDKTNTVVYLGYAGVATKGGFRFPNVTIPAGATILTAKITFQAFGTATASITMTIKGEANNNPATFSTYTDFDGRTRTTANAPWVENSTWNTNTDYDTPDITSIIQEIIGLSGWASGNAMVIFVEDNGSVSYKQPKSYETSTTVCARLIVTWKVDQTVNAGLQSGSKTILAVSENTDQVLSQNLQAGSKTILSPSLNTDQILSQNLLTSITEVLSVLLSTDQILSVNLVPGTGSPYEVTVEIIAEGVNVTVDLGLLLAVCSALESSLQTDQILSQSLIAKIGEILGSSQNTDQILSQNILSAVAQALVPSEKTDQILQQNILSALGEALPSSENTDQILHQNMISALALLYEIFLRVGVKPEGNFGYRVFKHVVLPGLPEGDFSFGKSSLEVPDQGPEGSFKFKHIGKEEVN